MKFDANKALGLTSVVIGLVGLYLAYRFFNQLKKGGETVGNTIGDAAASVLVDNSLQITSGVVLPSGERVTWQAIIKAGSQLRYVSVDVYSFMWKGTSYKVVPPRRPDGYLNATRLQ